MYLPKRLYSHRHVLLLLEYLILKVAQHLLHLVRPRLLRRPRHGGVCGVRARSIPAISTLSDHHGLTWPTQADIPATRRE